jgi:hypothetical protein
MTAGIRFGDFSQGHRRIRSCSEGNFDLQGQELAIFYHRWRVKSKQLIFVGLRQGDVRIGVAQDRP